MRINDQDTLEVLGDLLGVSSDDFQHCLAMKEVKFGREVSLMGVSHTVASAARHALLVHLYGKVVSHVISLVNAHVGECVRSSGSSSSNGTNARELTVVDMFGFDPEGLGRGIERDALESFAANFVSESFHRAFVEDVFTSIVR